MNNAKSELVQVSKDVISEEKKIQFSKQEQKMGGPYSKTERHFRQNRVFKLHFEYGYSARGISEKLNISRNTINSDINFWMEQMAEKWKIADPETWVIENLQRLELQRIRFRVGLDKTNVFEEKIILEKMLLEIESKIVQTKLKLVYSITRAHNDATKMANEYLEEKKIDQRFVSYNDSFRVSEKTREKISKLVEEDRKSRPDV